MKTYTARWVENGPQSWLLKTPSRDGGTVLATVTFRRGWFDPDTYYWQAGEVKGECASKRAAQRAARAALRGEGRGDELTDRTTE